MMTDKELFDCVSAGLRRCQSRENQLEGKFDITVRDCDASRNVVNYIYNPKADERNVYGGVHGGTTATVLDFVMALHVGTMTNAFAGTIQLSLQYLRPMMADEYLIECTCLHAGNKVLQASTVVYDMTSNKPVATANGSYNKVNITVDQLK